MSTTSGPPSTSGSATSCSDQGDQGDQAEDEMEVVFRPDGTFHFVHDDRLQELMAAAFPGRVRTFRAGHVEPDGAGGWSVDVGPLLREMPAGEKPPEGEATIARTRTRGEALAIEKAFVMGHLRGRA